MSTPAPAGDSLVAACRDALDALDRATDHARHLPAHRQALALAAEHVARVGAGVLATAWTVEDRREPARCTATTRAGRPCRAWALRGGPRCHAHATDAERVLTEAVGVVGSVALPALDPEDAAP